jgi:hypothetical protein
MNFCICLEKSEEIKIWRKPIDYDQVYFYKELIALWEYDNNWSLKISTLKSGYNKGTWTPKFIAALFTIAKLLKHLRCPHYRRMD